MVNDTGGNHTKIKLQNQTLLLKLIATNEGISRVGLSQKTGLSKMTISNLISQLIAAGLVAEGPCASQPSSKLGRNPIALGISQESACICGISIKRHLCQIVLADLAGNILEREVLDILDRFTAEQLVDFLKNGFTLLKERCRRSIMAVGISSIGPVDCKNGVILNPPFFYDIENLPIVEIMQEYTSLPAFLINDGNAGAYAELIYGRGTSIRNFAYLHIMYGIGSGFVLEGQVYNGDEGQSGEIGHSTINFDGPRCGCGNRGCLELYANIENVRQHISEISGVYPSSPLTRRKDPSLLDVIDAANLHDFLAVTALERYLSYVAHAMTNIINFLDLSHIIVDYASTVDGTVLEDILLKKIVSSVSHFQSKNIQMARSHFKGEAPLIGAIALVAGKVFDNQLPFA